MPRRLNTTRKLGTISAYTLWYYQREKWSTTLFILSVWMTIRWSSPNKSSILSGFWQGLKIDSSLGLRRRKGNLSLVQVEQAYYSGVGSQAWSSEGTLIGCSQTYSLVCGSYIMLEQSGSLQETVEYSTRSPVVYHEVFLHNVNGFVECLISLGDPCWYRTRYWGPHSIIWECLKT